jgi:hypothetical protein
MAIQARKEISSWIASADVNPCPFCGKPPVFHPLEPEREGNAWASIRCETKSCPTYKPNARHGVEVGDGATVADERGTTGYMAAALKRWNKRA